MKKKSIYDFDFTSNMILSIFSNIEFLFVKKENAEKSYKHPDSIRRPKCDGFWKNLP